MNFVGFTLFCIVMISYSHVHLQAFRNHFIVAKKVVLDRTTRSIFTLSAANIEVRKPTKEEIARCLQWSTWGCGVSTFPWTYSDQEVAYITAGKVEVTPTNGRPILIQQGDLVVFPAGMSCTWNVIEGLRKHYSFD